MLTDTGSFYYIIETENVSNNFTETANYLTSVINQENQNMIIKITLSLVKRKMNIKSVRIKSFVGLKSKIFTYLTEDDHKFKKAKSINENVVNDELKYEN